MPHFPSKKTLLAFGFGLTTSAWSFVALPEQNAALNGEAVGVLLTCPVSLRVARENLATIGYVLREKDSEHFSTEFKTSERDSERRLLGSFAIERARQYEVSAQGDSAIRFTPRYRETVFASGAPGNRRDTTREYAVPLSGEMSATLKDMQNEVCQSADQKPPSAAESKRHSEIDRYLQDRCKLGDAVACNLLPQENRPGTTK